MKCKNHPEVDAEARCAGCQETFCPNCLIELEGKKYCSDCKIMAVRETPVIIDESKQEPCQEANDALKYALIGILCFGIVLEPFAIVKALQAKKRFKEEPNLTGEGKATAALVIAPIMLVLWVLGMIARFSGEF